MAYILAYIISGITLMAFYVVGLLIWSREEAKIYLTNLRGWLNIGLCALLWPVVIVHFLLFVFEECE